ncbi:Hypothetical predicted protein [Podarcis lilfordi]|uniref:Uncharacterized protein n=1 Tax=Podarcis lilfordi TaxID=74358 RepID=A0AA35KD24_9SAUR|nr:Hypothetical predicted protein [Podarcis lilfordi]
MRWTVPVQELCMHVRTLTVLKIKNTGSNRLHVAMPQIKTKQGDPYSLYLSVVSRYECPFSASREASVFTKLGQGREKKAMHFTVCTIVFNLYICGMIFIFEPSVS